MWISGLKGLIADVPVSMLFNPSNFTLNQLRAVTLITGFLSLKPLLMYPVKTTYMISCDPLTR